MAYMVQKTEPNRPRPYKFYFLLHQATLNFQATVAAVSWSSSSKSCSDWTQWANRSKNNFRTNK